MEILSNGNKKQNFLRLMLETFLQSFIPHTPSEEMIFDFFLCKFPLLVAMVTNQIKKLQQKKICLVEDHSRNISAKVLSKYLQ